MTSGARLHSTEIQTAKGSSSAMLINSGLQDNKTSRTTTQGRTEDLSFGYSIFSHDGFFRQAKVYIYSKCHSLKLFGVKTILNDQHVQDETCEIISISKSKFRRERLPQCHWCAVCLLACRMCSCACMLPIRLPPPTGVPAVSGCPGHPTLHVGPTAPPLAARFNWGSGEGKDRWESGAWNRPGR